MSWIDFDIIVKLHQLVEETVVHILRTSAWQIGSTTLSNEQRIASEQFAIC
jgi:hypothetical protein